MRALWLADIASDAGLNVIGMPGWTTRGRDELDLAWQVVHHTASPPGKNAPSLTVVTEGRADLSGPLCNILIGRDGTCYVIASGRANHAGVCRYPDGTDGNRRSLGWECENNGVGEPWPNVQTEAMVRLCAAVSRHLGWGASRTVGHKEIAIPKGRKIDPYGIDMATFRSAVARLLIAPQPDGDDELNPTQSAQLQGLAEQLTAPDRLPLLAEVFNTPGKVDALAGKVEKVQDQMDAANIFLGGLYQAVTAMIIRIDPDLAQALQLELPPGLGEKLGS